MNKASRKKKLDSSISKHSRNKVKTRKLGISQYQISPEFHCVMFDIMIKKQSP